MELSQKGYVCRNKKCKFYRNPHFFPPQKKIQAPESSEQKSADLLTAARPNIKCCPKSAIDIRYFFESMSYLGSVQSRKNQYFCYEHEGIFMESTGLKELTRFNAVREQDLDIIETFIQNKLNSVSFSAQNLRDVCIETPCNSHRINEIKHLERQGKAEHNELYWLMLSSCYILTAKGVLTLEKQGRGVQFIINDNQDLFTSEDSIYSNVKFLANINENTAAFEMDPFYLEVRCNGYRGSIVPYIKEEIEYLNKLIEPLQSRHRLNIDDLKESMDYSNRFHRLYDLLGWRNIQNDRDEQEFFDRRIKSALELVAKLKGTIRSDKDGRTKVFIKR